MRNMRFNRYMFVSLLSNIYVLFNNSCHNNLVCCVRTPYFWRKSAFTQSCITLQPLQLLKKYFGGNYGQEVVCLVEFIFSSLLSTSFLHHTLPPDRDPAAIQRHVIVHTNLCCKLHYTMFLFATYAYIYLKK